MEKKALLPKCFFWKVETRKGEGKGYSPFSMFVSCMCVHVALYVHSLGFSVADPLETPSPPLILPRKNAVHKAMKGPFFLPLVVVGYFLPLSFCPPALPLFWFRLAVKWRRPFARACTCFQKVGRYFFRPEKGNGESRSGARFKARQEIASNFFLENPSSYAFL